MNILHGGYVVCDRCDEQYRPSSMRKLPGREGVYCYHCVASMQHMLDLRATPHFRFALMNYGPDIAFSAAESLQAAHMEGRLDPFTAESLGVETGTYECPVCGILNWTAEDAKKCCYPATPGEPMPGNQLGRTW